jgi:hypothetical protein
VSTPGEWFSLSCMCLRGASLVHAEGKEAVPAACAQITLSLSRRGATPSPLYRLGRPPPHVEAYDAGDPFPRQHPRAPA